MTLPSPLQNGSALTPDWINTLLQAVEVLDTDSTALSDALAAVQTALATEISVRTSLFQGLSQALNTTSLAASRAVVAQLIWPWVGDASTIDSVTQAAYYSQPNINGFRSYISLSNYSSSGSIIGVTSFAMNYDAEPGVLVLVKNDGVEPIDVGGKSVIPGRASFFISNGSGNWSAID